MTASRPRNFKPILSRDYLQIEQKNFSSLVNLACPILHIDLPKFLVIFKHEWECDKQILLKAFPSG